MPGDLWFLLTRDVLFTLRIVVLELARRMLLCASGRGICNRCWCPSVIMMTGRSGTTPHEVQPVRCFSSSLRAMRVAMGLCGHPSLAVAILCPLSFMF